jgi:hypothetical protein
VCPCRGLADACRAIQPRWLHCQDRFSVSLPSQRMA